MKDIKQAMADRRSVYAISGESVISDERIKETLAHAVKHVPSPYNSQSQRLVLLQGENHLRLWDIVRAELKKIVPAKSFAKTEEKLSAFESGYATVLFFNDDAVTDSLIEQFPSYADNFIKWADQANGMIQYAVWTLLSAEGLGASLQHYNPLIDDEVKRAFNLPAKWKLYAQMPFGKPVQHPGDKDFQAVSDRFIVLD